MSPLPTWALSAQGFGPKAPIEGLLCLLVKQGTKDKDLGPLLVSVSVSCRRASRRASFTRFYAQWPFYPSQVHHFTLGSHATAMPFSLHHLRMMRTMYSTWGLDAARTCHTPQRDRK